MATAFWVPKETKSQAPHETLFTILLQPAPMNTLSSPTCTSLLLAAMKWLYIRARAVCSVFGFNHEWKAV